MEKLKAENLELRLQVAKLKKQVVDQQIKLIATEARFQISSLDPTLRALDFEIKAIEAELAEIVSTPIAGV